MNTNMAHRHEALLNEPCVHCAAEPLAKMPDGYLYDVSEWLVALAAGVVLALIVFAFIVLVLVQ
jgi:hypothetical protein